MRDITNMLTTRDCSHPNCDREAAHHDLCHRHFQEQVNRARQVGLTTEQIVRACANGGLSPAINRAVELRKSHTRENELRLLLEELSAREEHARHESDQAERSARAARRVVVSLARERFGVLAELDAIAQHKEMVA